VAGAGIKEKVGAALDAGDVPGRVERALQTTIDSRVEEKVIQGITGTGFEGTVKTAVKEVAIAQRVDTEVANAVSESAHVKGTVSSAVTNAGIEDKVGAAVNACDVPGRVERALLTTLDSRVQEKVI